VVEMNLLNRINNILKLELEIVKPDIQVSVGDVVFCMYRQIGIGEKVRGFLGRCISVRGQKEIHECIILRNVFGDVAAEYIFYRISNRIVELYVSKNTLNKFRSNLYYLRKRGLKKSKIKYK
jgi:ribosomal protein L19